MLLKEIEIDMKMQDILKYGKDKTLLMLLIYKLLLDVSYIFYLNELFDYMGFKMNPDFIKIVESYILLTIVYYAFKNTKRKFSKIILKTLFLMMVIPTLSIYGFKGESRLFMYFFVISFIITILITKFPKIKIIKPKVNRSFIFIFVGMYSLIIFSILIYLNGIPSLQALNIMSVYEVRENINYGTPLMKYFVVWQAKVTSIFIIGVSFYYKKYRFMALGLFLQFVLFLMTGHKAYLFSPVLLISLLILYKFKNMFLISIIGLSSVVFGGLFLYITGISNAFSSLFIRRLIFIPAQNYFYYYEYFSTHKFMMLSHSIFSPFVDNPYDKPIPNVIGDVFYNKDMWVNTGYLADAYMNFGFIGMILFSIVLGVLFLFVDSIFSRIKVPIVLSALFISFFSLLNGALLTTMLTSGILFGITILFFYPAHINKEEINRTILINSTSHINLSKKFSKINLFKNRR
jgi:oligosaccharide repeat unit polymerase